LEIELPDGTILDAPDDADPSAVAKAYLAKQNAPAQPAPTLGQQVQRQLGLTARVPIDAMASLPLVAADAGIAARNAIEGRTRWFPEWISGPDAPGTKREAPYQSASQMYEQAMGSVFPRPTGAIEKGANIAGQMLVGSKLPAPQAAQQAPAAFDPKAMRTLALQKARDAGYVVPPSTTNPTVLNRFLESWGGKTATAQEASVRNQPITDKLVKSDLGLSVGDDVGEGTLAAIRREAATTGYKPIRGVGTIRLDSQYSNALDDIASPFAKAESAFPGVNKNDVIKTVESLKQKSVDSDTAVSTISILRDKADAAYRQGDGGLGKAYKGMAKALEDALERSLERRGPDAKELLSQYRDARSLIAKTHSAQKALNPELGNFDARKLAQQLNAGKPLTGGMKQAGQTSQAFKEATKLLTDSGSVRNTDVILGGGAAALSGNPAPLLYPFSRMAVRDFMLSQLGQGLLATPRPNYVMRPDVVLGATTGLLGPE
jgi:hypothetical protein